MQNILSEYYRTPLTPSVVYPSADDTNGAGFFRFGPDAVCYGECSGGVAKDAPGSDAFDVAKAVSITDRQIRLPFDIGKVIENLRRERYRGTLSNEAKGFAQQVWIRECYYSVREILPVWFRRHLQRAYLKDWKTLSFPNWPVDVSVDSLHEMLLQMTMIAQGCKKVPFIWFWPDGASCSLILTHDVETAVGRDFCGALMDMDASHGFRASFQVVPEKRYEVPDSYVEEIRARGFEFNIHDLNHDSRLFEERDEFLRRAKKINEYVKKYNARGFRAGAMYHNLDWYDAFEFSYDMSVPNVAHLEPQRGGCCTVMPFFVGRILEIPLTASQDYSLFHILNDYSMEVWKKQIQLVQQRHGLLSFIVHPDYVISRRPRAAFESLLAYLRQTCERDRIWATLPGEVDRWWRARDQMQLIETTNGYRIEGPESDRARIAYAALECGRIVYSLDSAPHPLEGER